MWSEDEGSGTRQVHRVSPEAKDQALGTQKSSRHRKMRGWVRKARRWQGTEPRTETFVTKPVIKSVTSPLLLCICKEPGHLPWRAVGCAPVWGLAMWAPPLEWFHRSLLPALPSACLLVLSYSPKTQNTGKGCYCPGQVLSCLEHHCVCQKLRV